MTITEAKRIVQNFYGLSAPGEDDVFLFTEALAWLIDTTHDSRYMLDLGGYYYGEKNFRLAQKYYEMAAECGNTDAYAGLGYIFYYGRNGEPDYRKAFEWYTKAAEAGDIQCAYKLADMYKNGYYVNKDPERYRQIIEELYPKVRNARHLNEPLPEIFSRLAGIRAEEGKPEEALELYFRARDFLAQRIRYNPFFGNLSIMKGLIRSIYSLSEFDEEDFSLYDLYHLLSSPVKVSFLYGEEEHTVETAEENRECGIRFDDKWFRTADDFFAKASIGGKLLTDIENQLELFEVINRE